MKCSEMLVNVWTKPRLRRRATATLIDKLPAVDSECVGNQTSRLRQLRSVVTVHRHRFGNAVRGENYSRRSSIFQLAQCGANVVDIRFDKERVIVEHAQLLDAWGTWSNRCLCVTDVLTILPATRV